MVVEICGQCPAPSSVVPRHSLWLEDYLSVVRADLRLQMGECRDQSHQRGAGISRQALARSSPVTITHEASAVPCARSTLSRQMAGRSIDRHRALLGHVDNGGARGGLI